MCLLAGVTTVRDCGDRGLVTLRVRDAIARRWLNGPRILAAGTPITTSGGHLDWCGCQADSVDDVRRAVARLCSAGVDLVKIVASGGNMTPGSDPLQPQYSATALAAATAEAHQRGRRVAVHALNAEAIRRATAAGVDSVEHCLWNGPDGQYAFDARAARELVDRGIWIGTNMAGVDRILLPAADDEPHVTAAHRHTLRQRWAGARELLSLGARVMISSDAGTRYARFEDFSLSLVCAVHALDLSPLETIHRATLVPARATGLGDDLGSLQPGKRADILVVEGDPSIDVADMRRVREVWCDGQPRVLRGAFVAPESRPLIVPEVDRGL